MILDFQLTEYREYSAVCRQCGAESTRYPAQTIAIEIAEYEGFKGGVDEVRCQTCAAIAAEEEK